MDPVISPGLIFVYFLYGLAFFSMGLAILLELGRTSRLEFAWALRPLAGFGLVHGVHEWLEMFLLLCTDLPASSCALRAVGLGRIILLAASFLMLLSFGGRLIAGRAQRTLRLGLMTTVAMIWAAGMAWLGYRLPAGPERLVDLDVYTRYALAIPGSALAAWALALQQRRFSQAGMRTFGVDAALAAVAFGLYGAIGQLFASPSRIFPSLYLNSQVFLEWFGFPVQMFRGLMACLAAVFIIRSLRAFEEETRLQIETLREARLAEQRRLETLRAELLHRTVRAQEDERARIARELHDELGQTLTALGLGLRGLVGMAPDQIAGRVKQLETLVADGLAGLQNLIAGLHPPQLDDLGLLPALRWYAREVKSRYNLTVELISAGPEPPLPPEMRITLYRIIQEALTNVVRHAGADRVTVRLEYTGAQVLVTVEDNGRGFDVQTLLGQHLPARPSWGLLGMMERASLAGGRCRIESQPGAGTRVHVELPLPKTNTDDHSTSAG